MTTKYFRWLFDSKYKGHPWFIGEPRLENGTVVDAWTFGRCARIDPPFAALSAPVLHGSERAPSYFGAFDLLYVKADMAAALLRHAEKQIQLIPVQVENFDEEIFIVNVLSEIKCVDEARSTFQKYLPGNISRPDKVGGYEIVAELFIDPESAVGFEIFRPWGWKVAVIVSERIKEVITQVGAQGTKFQEV